MKAAATMSQVELSSTQAAEGPTEILVRGPTSPGEARRERSFNDFSAPFKRFSCNTTGHATSSSHLDTDLVGHSCVVTNLRTNGKYPDLSAREPSTTWRPMKKLYSEEKREASYVKLSST